MENRTHYRQGDILFVRTTPGTERGDKIQDARKDDVVVAYGEATGHRHRFPRGSGGELFETPGQPSETERILRARRLVNSLSEIEIPTVYHEEHGAISMLSEGEEEAEILVLRQTEYVRPGVQRTVAD